MPEPVIPQLSPKAKAMAYQLTFRGCKNADARAAIMQASANLIACAAMDDRHDVDVDEVFADIRAVVDELIALGQVAEEITA